MSNFFSVITFGDIVFSFAAAYVLTLLIKRLPISYKFIGTRSDITIDYDPVNLRAVIKSCSELFPVDKISFRGKTFRRGSLVEILTEGNRKIIGELIGANNDNMICLITSKHIIAREVSEILSITLVGAEIDNENSHKYY